MFTIYLAQILGQGFQHSGLGKRSAGLQGREQMVRNSPLVND